MTFCSAAQVNRRLCDGDKVVITQIREGGAGIKVEIRE